MTEPTSPGTGDTPDHDAATGTPEGAGHHDPAPASAPGPAPSGAPDDPAHEHRTPDGDAAPAVDGPGLEVDVDTGAEEAPVEGGPRDGTAPEERAGAAGPASAAVPAETSAGGLAAPAPGPVREEPSAREGDETPGAAGDDDRSDGQSDQPGDDGVVDGAAGGHRAAGDTPSTGTAPVTDQAEVAAARDVSGGAGGDAALDRPVDEIGPPTGDDSPSTTTQEPLPAWSDLVAPGTAEQDPLEPGTGEGHPPGPRSPETHTVDDGHVALPDTTAHDAGAGPVRAAGGDTSGTDGTSRGEAAPAGEGTAPGTPAHPAPPGDARPASALVHAQPASDGSTPAVPTGVRGRHGAVDAPRPEKRTGWGALASSFHPRPTRSQLLAGLLCALLGFALVVQVSQTQEDQLSTLPQSDLVRLLDETTQRAGDLEEQVASLQATRDELQSGTGRQRAALELAERQAATQGILSGRLPAQGPGLEIEVVEVDGRVGALKLFNMLEELRNAGVEAVQLNGIRLVTGSYFEDVEGRVVVDGQEISSPYRWVAIGDPSTLETALEIPGGAMAAVRNDGARPTITQHEQVVVDATREPVAPQFATPVPVDESADED